MRVLNEVVIVAQEFLILIVRITFSYFPGSHGGGGGGGVQGLIGLGLLDPFFASPP